MNVKIGYSKLAGAVIALANRDVEKALVPKHKISASAFLTTEWCETLKDLATYYQWSNEGNGNEFRTDCIG